MHGRVRLLLRRHVAHRASQLWSEEHDSSDEGDRGDHGRHAQTHGLKRTFASRANSFDTQLVFSAVSAMRRSFRTRAIEAATTLQSEIRTNKGGAGEVRAFFRSFLCYSPLFSRSSEASSRLAIHPLTVVCILVCSSLWLTGDLAVDRCQVALFALSQMRASPAEPMSYSWCQSAFYCHCVCAGAPDRVSSSAQIAVSTLRTTNRSPITTCLYITTAQLMLDRSGASETYTECAERQIRLFRFRTGSR